MTIKHYPLGSFPSQDFWFSICVPDNLDPNKKYMLIPVCPGQGEAEGNIGDLHSCVRIATHGMFANLRSAVDQYPMMLIFVNTPITSKFKNKEVLKCIKWAIANLPVDENNIWTFGHSLGWYGLGNYGFTDPELAAIVRGTFVSASGPYTATPGLWKNMEENNILVMGATALNDTAMKTAPIYTQKIYDNLPKNKVFIYQFPASRYADQEQAHNSMAIQLSKITGLELNADMVRGNLIHSKAVMNIYEYAMSNPKGSLYQSPDKPYTGPIFPANAPAPTNSPVVIPEPATPPAEVPLPDPIPEPIKPPVVTTPAREIDRIYYWGSDVRVTITYKNGEKKVLKGTKADPYVNIDFGIDTPEIPSAKKLSGGTIRLDTK